MYGRRNNMGDGLWDYLPSADTAGRVFRVLNPGGAAALEYATGADSSRSPVPQSPVNSILLLAIIGVGAYLIVKHL